MNILSDTTIDELKARIRFLEQENQTLRQQHIDIEKAKELYLKIFEDFPALIWRAGLDKNCNHFNRTWLDFTGRTMEQEVGTGWTEGVHPDDFQFCLNTYVSKFDNREPFWMDYRLLNKHHEYRWIRDYGRPFFDLDDSFAGYIGSCYDVTEEKENENELRELNLAKDKFLSILAHDLISPFNNILGSAEMLANNFSNFEIEKGVKMAQSIYNSAKNTLDLLQNLLEWGNYHLKNKPINLRRSSMLNIASKCFTILQPLAENKSINILLNIDPSLMVIADENMIQSVLRNLITNAIKFSPNGSKIIVSAKSEDQNVVVEVKDFGIGINEIAIQRLFKLGENPSTRGTINEKGTGLGLVLCKDFIEKQGGKIWVESESGKGSRFIFTIPERTM